MRHALLVLVVVGVCLVVYSSATGSSNSAAQQDQGVLRLGGGFTLSLSQTENTSVARHVLSASQANWTVETNAHASCSYSIRVSKIQVVQLCRWNTTLNSCKDDILKQVDVKTVGTVTAGPYLIPADRRHDVYCCRVRISSAAGPATTVRGCGQLLPPRQPPSTSPSVAAAQTAATGAGVVPDNSTETNNATEVSSSMLSNATTTFNPATMTRPSESTNSAAAGLVVGILCVVTVISLVLLIICRKRKQKLRRKAVDAEKAKGSVIKDEVLLPVRKGPLPLTDENGVAPTEAATQAETARGVVAAAMLKEGQRSKAGESSLPTAGGSEFVFPGRVAPRYQPALTKLARGQLPGFESASYTHRPWSLPDLEHDSNHWGVSGGGISEAKHTMRYVGNWFLTPRGCCQCQCQRTSQPADQAQPPSQVFAYSGATRYRSCPAVHSHNTMHEDDTIRQPRHLPAPATCQSDRKESPDDEDASRRTVAAESRVQLCSQCSRPLVALQSSPSRKSLGSCSHRSPPHSRQSPPRGQLARSSQGLDVFDKHQSSTGQRAGSSQDLTDLDKRRSTSLSAVPLSDTCPPAKCSSAHCIDPPTGHSPSMSSRPESGRTGCSQELQTASLSPAPSSDIRLTTTCRDTRNADPPTGRFTCMLSSPSSSSTGHIAACSPAQEGPLYDTCPPAKCPGSEARPSSPAPATPTNGSSQSVAQPPTASNSTPLPTATSWQPDIGTGYSVGSTASLPSGSWQFQSATPSLPGQSSRRHVATPTATSLKASTSCPDLSTEATSEPDGRWKPSLPLGVPIPLPLPLRVGTHQQAGDADSGVGVTPSRSPRLPRYSSSESVVSNRQQVTVGFEDHVDAFEVLRTPRLTAAISLRDDDWLMVCLEQEKPRLFAQYARY